MSPITRTDAIAARYVAPVLRKVIGGLAHAELVFFDAIGAFSGYEAIGDSRTRAIAAESVRNLSQTA